MTLEVKEPYIEDNGLSEDVGTMELTGDEPQEEEEAAAEEAEE